MIKISIMFVNSNGNKYRSAYVQSVYSYVPTAFLYIP